MSSCAYLTSSWLEVVTKIWNDRKTTQNQVQFILLIEAIIWEYNLYAINEIKSKL